MREAGIWADTTRHVRIHAWAPIYDAWAAHMTEDVAHYVSLARETDGPVVELAVGSGRVAIEVVRATGKPVTVNAEGDIPARAVADLFPAYDDDGGLLLVLTPSQ